MLEPLLESEKKEKILFFLYSQGEGYAREIARAFRFNLNTVQNQLQKLENHGVLYSRLKGKMRIFSFDSRYPFRDELEALLKKAMMLLPEEDVRKFYGPPAHHRQAERSREEYSLRGRISFGLSNPWEKSRLDRFMPSQKISQRNMSANSKGLRKE